MAIFFMIMGYAVCGFIAMLAMDFYHGGTSGNREWGESWAVGFLWPLAFILFILAHIPRILMLFIPSRGQVTLSRRQQRKIMFEQEQNRVLQERNALHAEYDKMIGVRV